MAQMRLDKLLSDAGVASRRALKEIFRAGRVQVDGQVVFSGAEKVDPREARVTLDGQPVAPPSFHYLMMNKPAGYVSSTEERGAPTVLDLLDESYRQYALYPAGRLDKDTEGLLLLTDDGVFCHDVISPRKKVIKRYFAVVQGSLSPADIAAFRQGITLGDGTVCRPASLDILRVGEVSEARVSISEGKYHQVRRMFAALGKRVLYLKRVAIGGLELDSQLECGGYRDVLEEERQRIFTELEKN